MSLGTGSEDYLQNTRHVLQPWLGSEVKSLKDQVEVHIFLTENKYSSFKEHLQHKILKITLLKVAKIFNKWGKYPSFLDLNLKLYLYYVDDYQKYKY